jgi:hypothetical protein
MLISFSFREALPSPDLPKFDSLLHHCSPDMLQHRHRVERRKLRGRSSVLTLVSQLLIYPTPISHLERAKKR